jgi:GMP synthase-like glutamine amidotransferase
MPIGLLQCDEIDEPFQHICGDYPKMFGDLLVPHRVELRIYRVDEGELPTDVDECDGWIGGGSRHSAFEDEAWIADLNDFVRRLHAAERRFVGVCFGHQVIAEALGGKVERAAGGWGVGVRSYEVVAERPWMQPAVGELRLVASHQDQVTALPDGAEVLAVADYCPVAAMAVGDHMLGIQGHPEFSPELSRALLESRRQRLGDDVVDAALATLNTSTNRRAVGRWIVEFLDR